MSSQDCGSGPSSRMKLFGLLAVAFAAGMLFNTWRMVRLPIDEYHSYRMDIEEKLDEIQEIRNE